MPCAGGPGAQASTPTGIFFSFGLRGSRPSPSRSGGILRLQLRTDHLGPPGPRRLCAPDRAPRECRAREPLTLLCLPRAVHDPPRAPTPALNCKVLGAGNGQPGARFFLNHAPASVPSPSLRPGSPFFSRSLGSSQSKAAKHI